MPTPTITAPVELYRDPAVFERERTGIFARTWQFFGLETDIVRPGEYLSGVLAGYPLLVIRDEQGGLRGYHNVCRHRAGPLVGDARGRCDRELVCRFHDWRYGFDGELKQATWFGPADGFDTTTFSLFPIRVESWRGFVFVNLDLDAAPLSQAVQPLEVRLGVQPRRPAVVRDSHEIACNWKVYVENYLDGYHQEGLHPAMGAEEKQLNVQVDGEIALYDLPDRSRADGGLWAWLWPNFGLSVYQGVLMIEHMRPLGPDRTMLEHIFIHEPEDPSVEVAIVNSERITEDDAWVSERVQRNLDAGVFQRGVLSPTYEGAVAWFQQRVAEVLGL